MTGSVRISDTVVTSDDQTKIGASIRVIPARREVRIVVAILALTSSSPAITSPRPRRKRSTICGSPPPGPPLPRYATPTMIIPKNHK